MPVSPICNVKCVFCSHSVGSSCHTSKPGFAMQVMSPKTAVARAIMEIKKDSRIRIIAVSGPGEPLANPETFETIELIRKYREDIHLCLSTNGTLLADNIQWLVKMGFKTLTVSMSTINPETASRIYEWARLGERTLTGSYMGSMVVEKQIRGISRAARAGIFVKVNSILIPTINDHDIVPLAKTIADAGASLQNIIPLVPNDCLTSMAAPHKEDLEALRNQAATYIDQFRHCYQCRSDVVGIPGCDAVL